MPARSDSGAFPRGHVIHRKQGVRLAAAEGGLELDDRIAALSVEALDHRVSSRRIPSVMKVRSKNADRVLIFPRRLAGVNGRDVGGKLRLWNVPSSTSRAGRRFLSRGSGSCLGWF